MNGQNSRGVYFQYTAAKINQPSSKENSMVRNLQNEISRDMQD